MTDNEIIKGCGEVCADNRFEIIEKFKNKLIEGTNIETAKDEMAVINNVLFRFWQMGWLDKLEDYDRKKAEIEQLKKLLESRHRVIESLEGTIISLPDEIRAETVKEFAERLHDLINPDWGKIHKQIDNLVKEFTEGKTDE